ncbi:hypothetical protein ABZX95_27725 [Streptomyces sp. NPDC004232]|uniref:hypothetical protein n=1 Tax=Streptomyces sp. NPDC004232 TaxID=3154454 RepID=UPI0033B7D7DB
MALTAFVVWLGLLVWLAANTGAGEVAWSRLLIVLGSVEAVTFAGVGALFGTTVQRHRVEELKEDREAAESRAVVNEQAAINGHKLAAAVRAACAIGPAETPQAAGTEQLSAWHAPLPSEAAVHLLGLAEKLFPEGK